MCAWPSLSRSEHWSRMSRLNVARCGISYQTGLFANTTRKYGTCSPLPVKMSKSDHFVIFVQRFQNARYQSKISPFPSTTVSTTVNTYSPMYLNISDLASLKKPRTRLRTSSCVIYLKLNSNTLRSYCLFAIELICKSKLHKT